MEVVHWLHDSLKLNLGNCSHEELKTNGRRLDRLMLSIWHCLIAEHIEISINQVEIDALVHEVITIFLFFSNHVQSIFRLGFSTDV